MPRKDYMELSLLIAGFAGGITRGLVGYLKYHFNYKNVKFNWGYFLLMVLVSGLVGIAAGWLVGGILADTTRINQFYVFLAGYAGGDFIDNAFKTIFKKDTIFSLPLPLKSKAK
jgi:hypothetical protein